MSHSLLVAHQGDVSRKLYPSFLLVNSFNFNFANEERSDNESQNEFIAECFDLVGQHVLGERKFAEYYAIIIDSIN